MVRIERLIGLAPEIDCGAPGQNEFLRREAVGAQYYGISATHIAVTETGEAVGFVTLAMSSVRFEAHERPHSASISTLPALLVAQLGVSTAHQGKGVGERLIRFSAGIAQSLRHSIGCRYLVVDCAPALAPYYERLGFRESKGEKRKRKQELKSTGRDDTDVAVRLALDVTTGIWREVDVAPPHLYATELHRAAAEGDIAMLESLLKAGVPANIKIGRGDDGLGMGATPLHVAAARAQIAAIRTLLASGADINSWDGDLETPLHWAVRHGQEIAVAALLVAGADPNVEGGNAVMTPLAYALHPKREGERIAEMLRQLGGVSTCEGEPYDPDVTYGEAPEAANADESERPHGAA